MSSHHFVKEGQEPVLLILEPLSCALIEPLLEWAPLVMVVDSVLEEVLRWGIKIDLVLAKVDQVETLEDKLLEQSPVKILSYQPMEDTLLIGLYFLINTRQTAVNILTIQADSIFERKKDFTSQLDIGVISMSIRWSAIPFGKFRKWLPLHYNLHIRGQSGQDFELDGIIQKNESFEVQKDGMVWIQSSAMFWIGESV